MFYNPTLTCDIICVRTNRIVLVFEIARTFGILAVQSDVIIRARAAEALVVIVARATVLAWIA